MNHDVGINAHTARDQSERLAFLDGIRGWGAMVVLAFHLFVDQGLRAKPEAIQLMHFFFLNGPFAVCVFFVTSGFSLSIGMLTRKSTDVLIRMAAGRYFRLAVPIFAICFVTDMLMRWNLVPSADQRPFPLNLMLPFEPSLLHVVSFSFFDVFVNYSQRISYNPPLWTMSFELIGSYIVFGLLVIRTRRLRWIVAGIFLVASLATVSLYAFFVAGVCIAEAYALNIHRSPLAQATCAAFLVLAAIWAMFLPFAPPGFTTSYFACVIVLCVALIGLNSTRRFFETSVSRFLGRISFPLYLVQVPIIYCFSLRAIAALEGLGLRIETSRLIAGVVTIPVCIIAALLFAPVDKGSVWIARSVGGWFSRQWQGSCRSRRSVQLTAPTRAPLRSRSAPSCPGHPPNRLPPRDRRDHASGVVPVKPPNDDNLCEREQLFLLRAVKGDQRRSRRVRCTCVSNTSGGCSRSPWSGS